MRSWVSAAALLVACSATIAGIMESRHHKAETASINTRTVTATRDTTSVVTRTTTKHTGPTAVDKTSKISKAATGQKHVKTGTSRPVSKGTASVSTPSQKGKSTDSSESSSSVAGQSNNKTTESSSDGSTPSSGTTKKTTSSNTTTTSTSPGSSTTTTSTSSTGSTSGTGFFTLTVIDELDTSKTWTKRISIQPNENLLQYTEQNFQVETEYGGGFVESINGIHSLGASSKSEPVDWFLLVNKSIVPVGAASIIPKPGDFDEWDYHKWNPSTGG